MKFFRSILLFVCCFIVLFSVIPAFAAQTLQEEEEALSGEDIPSGNTDVFSAVNGDADCDGSITSADARFALRTSVGLETPPEEIYALCDYDGDGNVTSADARAILRVSVGLDPLRTQKELKEERLAEEKKQFGYIDSAMDSVNQNNIVSTLTYLTKTTPDRGIFCENSDKAEKYLTQRLKDSGFDEKDINVFVSSWEGVRIGDVVAAIPTEVKNPDIYLLCAHYDCAEGVEGAVDNASGVAAVMEAARVLKAMNRDFGAELRFAFFDGEERGYIGAYRYLSVNTDDEEARHKFMLNIDMAGYSKLQPQKYLVVSTEPVCEPWPWREAKANFTSNAVDAAKQHIGSIGEEKYYSHVSAGMHDIVPFRKNNMDCATLSWRQYSPDSSHGSDFGLASPYTIHTSLDTLENIDAASVTNTAKLIVSSVLFALK